MICSITINYELITAIIAGLFTLVTALLAFITSQKNRKQESLRNIICKERIKYLDEFRTVYKKLILLLRKETLLNNFDNIELQIKNILEVSTNFECILKSFYQEEHELIECEKNLVKCAISYYQGEGLNEQYPSLLDKLYNLCQVYDWAYWKYIQKLAVYGKYLNSDEDFDKTYYELRNKIEK